MLRASSQKPPSATRPLPSTSVAFQNDQPPPLFWEIIAILYYYETKPIRTDGPFKVML